MTEKEKAYCVYRYWSPNGKSYVGQTNQTLNARASSNGQGYKVCPVFYSAIQHYGWDWFENHREVLAANLTKQQADKEERRYIRFYNSKAPNGYNVQNGGTFNTRELMIKPVVGINCFTKEVQIYESITEAKRAVGVKSTKISAVAHHRGNYKTAGGHVWVYLEEYQTMSSEEKSRLFEIMPPYHSKTWSKYYDIVRLNDGKRYSTLKDAAIDNHTFASNIGKVLNGSIHTSGKMQDGSPIKWARIKKEQVS